MYGNDAGMIIGRNKTYVVGRNETLIEIARRGRLGYQGLVSANPGVDPWAPGFSAELILPYETILPAELPPGITVNLAEFRLYLVWEEHVQMRVRIYPIGLGREGWNTPEGAFHVTVVVDNPVWTVPPDLRTERPGQPFLVPAGPDNPLGSHWIGLSVDGFGIHGTNRPFGIGRQVSHGCIRLYPEDIVDLAGRVENGPPVKIIYQPLKIAFQNNRLLLEAHFDYLGRMVAPRDEIRRRSRALGWQEPLDEALQDKVVREARGIPSPIATLD